jgi:uncharacterized membrane protein YkvA (DUF1232 family)
MLRLMKLWQRCGHDLRLLWFALRHPARPAWVWLLALLLAIYALGPLNFAIPWLGVLDDLVLLPLILNFALKFLPLAIRAEFARR